MSYKVKCRFCKKCNGLGCIGELPGMGGVFENINFIENVKAWNKYKDLECGGVIPKIRLAPMTGAVENIGYFDERQFYFDLIGGCISAEVSLSIGDGFPDEKLIYGLQALTNFGRKAAVFLKPYPKEKLFERLEAVRNCAEIIGIDIDAYNIVTMRNLVKLEKKTAADLLQIKNFIKVPFAVKGVFTEEDTELIRILKPEIAVVSNHGGRIETKQGSSADFLYEYGPFLSNYCSEIWVDGGLRTKSDLAAAASLGASEVMLGRPFATALLKDKDNGIKNFMKTLVS